MANVGDCEISLGNCILLACFLEVRCTEFERGASDTLDCFSDVHYARMLIIQLNKSCAQHATTYRECVSLGSAAWDRERIVLGAAARSRGHGVVINPHILMIL
eukprot:706062-Amphidinium_carterae.1